MFLHITPAPLECVKKVGGCDSGPLFCIVRWPQPQKANGTYPDWFIATLAPNAMLAVKHCAQSSHRGWIESANLASGLVATGSFW